MSSEKKMMNKEKGGYFQLEKMKGEAYYGGLLRFNLGRTAAAWFLKQAGCRKVYMPFFLCESVITAVERSGIEIGYYSIGRDFLPRIDGISLKDDEWLYVNNSYGILRDEYLTGLKARYGNVLADNTHAFFRRPAGDTATVYSVRKFFGVPDGAYLYPGDYPQRFKEQENDPDGDVLNKGFPMPEEQDRSHKRFAHLLGRFEEDAGLHYREMLDTADSFNDMPAMRMSALTENLLNGIDYEKAMSARNENFSILEEALSGYNLLTDIIPGTLKEEGPFVYPLHLERGSEIRSELIKRKIFVPRYWDTVPDKVAENSTEHDYSLNILPLPCDQRYGRDDMKEMAETVLELIK